MQLVTLMEVTGMYPNLKWVPREDNQLADALTHEDFSAFNPASRVNVSVDGGSFPTLFKPLKEGKRLYEQVEEVRANGKKASRVWPKVPNNKRLTVTQPW